MPLLCRLGAAPAQPLPQDVRVLVTLKLAPCRVVSVALLPQVFFHRFCMLKIVGDRRVDLLQRQGRKVFLDLLGTGTALESSEDRIERNA